VDGDVFRAGNNAPDWPLMAGAGTENLAENDDARRILPAESSRERFQLTTRFFLPPERRCAITALYAFSAKWTMQSTAERSRRCAR
jgi:hypothetical protein